MNEPTSPGSSDRISLERVRILEHRLDRAQRIAAQAVQILRGAVAHAQPGGVVALLDEVDAFFALLDAVESSARMARESARLEDAEEHAEDAYHLAIAARREARMRSEGMGWRAPTPDGGGGTLPM